MVRHTLKLIQIYHDKSPCCNCLVYNKIPPLILLFKSFSSIFNIIKSNYTSNPLYNKRCVDKSNLSFSITYTKQNNTNYSDYSINNIKEEVIFIKWISY